MKQKKQKPDRRREMQKRWFKREAEDGLRDVFLGACPICRGNVCGTLDEPECSDCGWPRDRNYFSEREAA